MVECGQNIGILIINATLQHEGIVALKKKAVSFKKT